MKIKAVYIVKLNGEFIRVFTCTDSDGNTIKHYKENSNGVIEEITTDLFLELLKDY